MELRLRVEGLLIGAYLNGDDKNIIYCSGLPQYPTSYHSFIQDLMKLNYNIFVPRYAGTWESDGEFSPLSSIETIKKTIEIVKRGYAVDTYSESTVSWQTNEATLALLGFSYGAMPALANSSLVAKTLLLMPFVTFIEGDSSAIEMQATLDFVQRGYKNVYRTSLTTMDFLGQYSICDLVQSKPEHLAVTKGTLDKTISNAQFEWLKENYMVTIQELPTKHSPNVGLEIYKRLLAA